MGGGGGREHALGLAAGGRGGAENPGVDPETDLGIGPVTNPGRSPVTKLEADPGINLVIDLEINQGLEVGPGLAEGTGPNPSPWKDPSPGIDLNPGTGPKHVKSLLQLKRRSLVQLQLKRRSLVQRTVTGPSLLAVPIPSLGADPSLGRMQTESRLVVVQEQWLNHLKFLFCLHTCNPELIVGVCRV